MRRGGAAQVPPPTPAHARRARTLRSLLARLGRARRRSEEAAWGEEAALGQGGPRRDIPGGESGMAGWPGGMGVTLLFLRSLSSLQ